MTKIEIMQFNLNYIRGFLGLSAVELGDMIGVTRQTINNLEAGRAKMSKTQYLAIMYVLEHEIYPTLYKGEAEMVQNMLGTKVLSRAYIFEEGS